MLFYKSWLETRWRFVGGFALIALSLCGSVLSEPRVRELMPTAASVDANTPLGRVIAESLELARTYRGYIWSQWFRENMPQLWTLVAIVLGTGGLLSHAAGRGVLFTLSLPVSRTDLMRVRALTALGQLAVLSLLPAVLLPLLSPAVGQSYSVVDALVHGLLMFVAGTAFFSLAFVLSTVFSDVWRPLLTAACIAFALAVFEQFAGDLSRHGVFRVMSGEAYFRGEGLPWVGLFVSAAASAAMLYAATRNIARQDF